MGLRRHGLRHNRGLDLLAIASKCLLVSVCVSDGSEERSEARSKKKKKKKPDVCEQPSQSKDRDDPHKQANHISIASTAIEALSSLTQPSQTRNQ